MKRCFFKGIALFVCVVMLLSGCGGSETDEYKRPKEMKHAQSGVFAENEQYELSFDGDKNCVFMKHKASGTVWSTIPYEHYLTDEMSMSLDSPIVIKYYDTSNGAIDTLRAYDSADEGGVSAVIKDSAALVTYHFDSVKISVTVSYRLEDDAMTVTLKNADVKENSSVKLLSVDVVPYLCSVKNSADKESYLFIPSGSGALMYTDEEITESAREFSGEVYGHDLSQTRLDDPAEDEPVRLPVFGAKSGNKALLGIIEQGDESCFINGMAGNPRNSYSNAYVTYNIRGYNNIEWDSATKDTVTDSILLAETKNTEAMLKISFFPLFDGEATYIGMANRYREYLLDKGMLEKSKSAQASYHVTVVGGTLLNEFTFGMPHKSLVKLTTLSEARLITEELSELVGEMPEAVLKGFGKYGTSISRLAGGFGFAGSLGSKKEQKAIEKYFKDNKSSLYTDFDIIRLTRSGGGFNAVSDVARTANSLQAGYFPSKVNVRTDNTELDKIKLLSRPRIYDAADKLIGICEGRVSGISLETLSSVAYSDYKHPEYALKGGTTKQVTEIIKSIKKSGYKFSAAAANSYAAGLADSIYKSPLQNGGYDALDCAVPFYEAVYRGYIPMYSDAVNLSPDNRRQILKIAESGVSPAFVLCYNLNRALIDSDDTYLYGIRFGAVKPMIKETVLRLAELHERTEGATISSHSIIGENITETVFSNGVRVTVNHSDKEAQVGGLKIPALDFNVN